MRKALFFLLAGALVALDACSAAPADSVGESSAAITSPGYKNECKKPGHPPPGPIAGTIVPFFGGGVGPFYAVVSGGEVATLYDSGQSSCPVVNTAAAPAKPNVGPCTVGVIPLSPDDQALLVAAAAACDAPPSPPSKPPSCAKGLVDCNGYCMTIAECEL